MLLSIRNIAVRFMAGTDGIPVTSVKKISHDQLVLKKVSASWLTKMLTTDQERIRQVIAETIL